MEELVGNSTVAHEGQQQNKSHNVKNKCHNSINKSYNAKTETL